MNQYRDKLESVEQAKKRILARIKRNCTAINNAFDEAGVILPGATLYLEGGDLHLINGASHGEGLNPKSRQDAIIGSAALDADGGGW